MSDTLRLWGRPTSTCTQRALWGLAEARRPVELILASATMGAGGPVGLGHAAYGIVDTPAYRARNPNGTIPTLQDGDFTLWDSLAILAYLAAGPGPLHLAGAPAIARTVQWMSWCNEHLDPPLHTLVMHLDRLPPAERKAASVDAARRAMSRPLDILDAHLRRQDYVGGPDFTIADIPCGISIHRWTVLAPDLPVPANIAAWHGRVHSRDAFQAHVAPASLHLVG